MNIDSKTLFLDSLHRDLEAKMTTFAGYQMPLHYKTGMIEEHMACRHAAVLFDISHMGQIQLTGPDIEQVLQRLTPTSIRQLKIGDQRYITFLNRTAGVLDDAVITRLENGYLLIVNAICRDKIIQHLANELPAQVEFKKLKNRVLLALQGPLSDAVLTKYCPQIEKLYFMQGCPAEINGIACFLSRSGYTGEDGFEISVENKEAEALFKLLLEQPSVIPAGLAARDSLRMEAGLCLYGNELNETITLLEAGLAWTINNPGEYVGAEAIRQQQKQGIKYQRTAWVLAGKSLARSGSKVLYGDNQQVGWVSSGGYSPVLKQGIAMAYIEKDYLDKPLYAEIRRHRILLQQTRFPFVVHRYHRRHP